MKEHLIKKAGIFLLLSMLFIGATPVQSNDLYVYLKNDTRQSFDLENVQKVTFTSTDLVVNKADGSTVPVSFADLKFFSLKYFEVSGNGITAPETKVAITVSFNPAVADVTVKSAKTITGLELYNLQGQKLLQLHPESLEATLPLAAYPAGVYLIQVADESGITVKKIIKN
jgi:hypothetical protein